MLSVAGIFGSRASAEQAVRGLLEHGIASQSIIFLTGEQADRVDSIPTTDAEAHGMGKTLGGFVGAVTGAGAGLGLGTALASLMVPGVGTILAAGLGAAATLGLGGGIAGERIGDASEDELELGVPRDDINLYRNMLKRGRSLVIANVNSHPEAEVASSVMHDNGAEDIDAARKELGEAA